MNLYTLIVHFTTRELLQKNTAPSSAEVITLDENPNQQEQETETSVELTTELVTLILI